MQRFLPTDAAFLTGVPGHHPDHVTMIDGEGAEVISCCAMG